MHLKPRHEKNPFQTTKILCENNIKNVAKITYLSNVTWQQNLDFCICAFYNIAKEKKDERDIYGQKRDLFTGSISFFNNTSYFRVTACLAGKGILVVLCGSDEIRTSAVMNRQ